MHTTKQFLKYVTASLITLATFSSGFIQAAPGAGQSVPCVRLNRIQDVDVLDDQHVVFRTGTNEYYLNKLPYACNGLKLNDAFTYRTSLNELCDVDVITVLDQIGSRVQTGPSCGLGKFEPVTKEEIKTLRDTL